MMATNEMKLTTIARRQCRAGERSLFEKILERATVLPFFDITRSVRIDRSETAAIHSGPYRGVLN